MNFVASGQANGAATPALSAGPTFNIGTCDAACFVVFTGSTVAQSFSVQTWSGATLTKIANATTFDASGLSVDWFAMVAPATGSHAVSFTWNTSAVWVIGFASFSGADQTGGATTFNNGVNVNNAGATSSQTKAVASANGDATVFGWTNVNTYTGQTQTPTADWQTSANQIAEGQHILSAGASDSYTAVMNTPADLMLGAGFHIKAAAAAAFAQATLQTERSILIPNQGPSRGLRALRAFPVPPRLWLPTTGADKERLPPIQRAPDEAIPFFRPAPGAESRRVPTTGQDVERLPPIGRSPDEATPFFAPSSNPVPTGFYPPTTGADRERLPPIQRAPDEPPGPFFARSPNPVPTGFSPPTTGADRERIFPIPRSPDESIPFFRPSQVPVPTRWLPTTGEDVERLPPIQRSPDEATPFFRPSQVPVPSILWYSTYDQPPNIIRLIDDRPSFFRPSTAVPISGMAWYKPDADRERPPPISRSPDEATPFFVRSPVPVPRTWLPQWDGWERPFAVVPDLAGSAFSFKTPQAGTPISGIAWYNWQDRERPPPQARPPDESIPFFVRSPVPVPGILWFKPDEGFRLPPVLGDPYGAQQMPPFIEPPLVPFYAQSNADDFNPLPPIFQADEPRGWAPRTPTVVSTISGIAWYVPGERYQPIPPAPGDGMAVWLPRFVPAVGIAGMAWFNPSGPDGRAFPGGTGSAEDGKSTWTAKTPPPPVGIAGMAWFTPAEQITRVDPSNLAINQAWGTVFPPNIPPIFVANQFTVSGPGVIDLFDPVTGVNYIFSPTQRRTV